jgi:hypothetical protein
VTVVEVNVMLHPLTDTAQRRLAVPLCEHDDEWRVPPSWRHEMVNVLASLTPGGVSDTGAPLPAWRDAANLFIPEEHSQTGTRLWHSQSTAQSVPAVCRTGDSAEHPVGQRAE